MKNFTKHLLLLCLFGMISIGAKAADIPNNEIQYRAIFKLTTTTSTYSSGLHTNAFNTTIQSHTFSNGKGIITFNADVTSIGESAFYKCTGLTGVSIPSSVTSIGNRAFSGCSDLISVTIPNSVTSIGSSAFEGCSDLISVTIPNSVTSIGSSAFEGCSGLKSVTIPNSVTSIGNYAFMSCSGLKSVTIPNSVTKIENSTFYNCNSLTSVTIPNSVTSISYDAFAYCKGLTSVTIPNSVTSIGYDAFAWCSGLTSVNITDLDKWAEIEFEDNDANPLYYAHNLYLNGQLVTEAKLTTAKKIGKCAFYGCSGLTSVTIPNSVTSIEESAFISCSGLTSIEIPNSVTSIGSYAFDGCSGLTSIEIPNSVTSIGSYAFDGCSGLTSIAVESGNKVYDSRDNCNAIIETSSNTLITGCMNTTIPNSVTSIGSSAFRGCSGLTSIEIPNSVTSIGNYAFRDCSGLASVYVEWKNANKIPSISSNDLPYSTCDLYVPIGTKTIYQSKNYWKTFINIYEYEPFGSCGENAMWSLDTKTGLLSITGSGEMTNYSSSSVPWYSYCSSIKSLSIGNQITSIGDYAFEGCSSLASVTIPNSVTSIGSHAFRYCTSLPVIDNIRYADTYLVGVVDKALSTYKIKEGIKWIAEQAFYGCSKLTSVTIPNSVTSIGSFAFSNCSGLTSVNITDLDKWVEIEFGDYSANPLYYAHNLYLNGQLVTEAKMTSAKKIGKCAFYGCSGLTSVTIPNSVTLIDEQSFYDCSGLTSVNITDLDKWAEIEFGNAIANPLYYAHNLYLNEQLVTEAELTTAKKICDYAFEGCSSMTSVTIPNSVTSIGEYAFRSCSGLTSMAIPNSVTSIGSHAFHGCSGLTSVEIPNSVTSIGYSAFQECENLKTANIQASLTYINSSMFYGCSNLVEIKLPPTIKTINSDAFRNCASLINIEIPSNATTIRSNAFAGCKSITRLTIPSSITSIDKTAFLEVYLQKENFINYSALNPITNNYWGAFLYETKIGEDFLLDGSTLVKYIGSKTDVVIPDVIQEIGYRAFYNCTEMLSVTIPNSVASIEERAFEECTKLKSVKIPTSVKTIGRAAFLGDKAVENFVIPSGVYQLQQSAIPDYKSNSIAYVPSTTTYVSRECIDECSTVIIEDGDESLSFQDRNADDGYWPSALNRAEDLYIGRRIIAEGYNYAASLLSDFYLTKITFGPKVTPPFYVSNAGFGRVNLRTAMCISKDAFQYQWFPTENCTIYVPIGSLDSYINNGWPKDKLKEVESLTIHHTKLVEIFTPDYDIDISGIEELKAYVFSSYENGEVKLEPTTIILSGQGILLEGNVGDYVARCINSDVSLDDNCPLKGTYSGTHIQQQNGDMYNYIISYDDGEVSFVPVEKDYDTQITRNQGYLTLPKFLDRVKVSTSGPIFNPTYDNMLLTDDIMGFVGETCVLPVKMNNAVEISAVQFDLCLPEGITIAQDEDGFDLVELGERSTARKHNTIETSVQPDGAVRVMCASSKNLTFDGNEGTILYITLNVASNMTDGEYVIKMKDVVLSTASSIGYEQPLFASKIKVSSYEMGDLNKDHNINVIDYTAMCSMIMGTDGDKYPLELADFSGNGKVDVTDLTALVNKIMSSTASAAKPEIIFRAKSAVAPDVNRLSLIPFTINPGETKEISLQMFNTAEICAYQTDLVLPEGIEVVKDDGFYMVDISTERTSAKRHNTMEAELQGDGSIRIMCASTKNLTFNGNEGEVAVITIKASETLEPGVYEILLKNNVLSTAESLGFEPADCESSVLVGSPEIASLNLNGDFTAKAIGEYNTALASNTKVAAMDFCNATSVDAATKIVTGNKNLLVYVAEGMSIANEDNAIIGGKCANLVLTDGYAFCAPKEFTATKASYTRAAASGLGTLCLPFAAKSVVGSLYELTSAESNKLTFTPVEEAKANTPYLYRSESAVIEETNATVETDAECEIVMGGWTMTGAYSTNVFSSEDNVFALYDGKLYKNTGTLTVNPFRAYFTTTGSASKAEISIDTPTGISNINDNDNVNDNYYNVNGVRVGKGYRGIVIKNGEKFIMK